MKAIACLKGGVSLLVALSLSIVSGVANAEEGLPTAWPSHPVVTETEAAPSTGMTYFWTGLGMTSVGLGVSGYGVYQGMHSNNVTAGYALLISGGSVALAGSVFSFVGMFQSMHYEDWMRKHPVLTGLSVSPTSVGYSTTF